MNFDQRRRIALAILSGDDPISRKAGSFLGQCAVDRNPLTYKQAAWFEQLAERAGFMNDGELSNG